MRSQNSSIYIFASDFDHVRIVIVDLFSIGIAILFSVCTFSLCHPGALSKYDAIGVSCGEREREGGKKSRLQCKNVLVDTYDVRSTLLSEKLDSKRFS